MRLYILGAGTPTPDRYGSAHVVELGAERFLFDCGPAATHKPAKAGLFPTEIDRLFFTHHHFDHDVDYPAFLLVRRGVPLGPSDRVGFRVRGA
jgi:ribonuclease Z